MKKLITLYLTLTILLMTLVSCSGKTYELPHDDFCFTVNPSTTVELNAEDRAYIIGILNEASWTNDLTDCGSDFVFYTQKQEVRYHSECGTFNDITNQRAMSVSDEQRVAINNILGEQ